MLLKDFSDSGTLPFCLSKMRSYILEDNFEKIKEYKDEPVSIFRKRRNFNLSDNLLVSREESERRLHLGCLSLAIVLVIACSIMTFVYGLTLRVEVPTIVIPGKREDEHQCKFFDN